VAIVGVGIDVVDISRFEESLRRTPGLADRLFTAAEAGRPPASLAARFAAKEALAKALGAPNGLAWHDAEVVSESTGRPPLSLRGTVAAHVAMSTSRSPTTPASPRRSSSWSPDRRVVCSGGPLVRGLRHTTRLDSGS
jgi:holo-[acyl-carrier protein] synthase